MSLDLKQAKNKQTNKQKTATWLSDKENADYFCLCLDFFCVGIIHILNYLPYFTQLFTCSLFEFIQLFICILFEFIQVLI
jgi:hypothetical protein